jgi:hypothetical protein
MKLVVPRQSSTLASERFDIFSDCGSALWIGKAFPGNTLRSKQFVQQSGFVAKNKIIFFAAYISPIAEIA